MGFASWYNERVVPRIVRCACSSPAIMRVREKVVPLASGDIFEIGCGGGLNQKLYDAGRLRSYAGMDPSEKGLDFTRSAATQCGRSGDIRHGVGEAIPFADESFDCVVCTFTLCSVSDAPQTLRELRRVLRPGGRLLYAEHGKAPDADVAKWQNRIEPVWKRIAGGCHLTRPVSSAIADAGGFALHQLGARYAPKTPRWAGWIEWGEAVKSA